jgi:methionyl-tRNA formyltransferase
VKLIFAGTPEFAAKHLEALLNSHHEICAVYTQPDRPKGRGLKTIASPVKQVLLDSGKDIPIKQPKTLRSAEVQAEMAALNADLMIVVAYGLISPKEVLAIPKLGCINVHASLLPRWRGAAPIQMAVLSGDKESGVTIMQMDEGLDTGDMLLKATCEITDKDTGESLHDKLAEIGPQALLDALAKMEAGELVAEKQDDSLTCYAHKLSKAQAQIDWSKSATEIDCMIRAFNSWPVAFTHFDDKVVRVWQASTLLETTSAQPGEIVEVSKKAIKVATGDGVLQLERLQLPGSKAMSVADILNGNKIQFNVGSIFK